MVAMVVLSRKSPRTSTRTASPICTPRLSLTACSRPVLQIPQVAWRYSFAKYRVKVYAHVDGILSSGHGPHTLGHYDEQGRWLAKPSSKVGAAA